MSWLRAGFFRHHLKTGQLGLLGVGDGLAPGILRLRRSCLVLWLLGLDIRQWVKGHGLLRCDARRGMCIVRCNPGIDSTGITLFGEPGLGNILAS